VNQRFKSIVLLAGVLALLASACDIQSLEGVDSVDASRAQPPPGAQIEPMPSRALEGSDQAIGAGPAPGTESGMEPANASSGAVAVRTSVDTVNAEDAATAESIQDPVLPTGPEVIGDDVDPETIPSPEELDAMLDQVNLGPRRSVPPGSDAIVGGPAPGTESHVGPMNDASGVEPERPPSGEERNGIMDRVNWGGPELPGSDEGIGEEHKPATESDTGHGEEQDDILPWVDFLVETLCNWLQGFLD
jgi:hypothetical protein